jgi:hypothetical protein
MWGSQWYCNDTTTWAVEENININLIAASTDALQFYWVFLSEWLVVNEISGGSSKAVPLQAWSGPEGSRKLSFPDFLTTAQDGDKVVGLTHRPRLPPRKYSWYSFLLEAESTAGP